MVEFQKFQFDNFIINGETKRTAEVAEEIPSMDVDLVEGEDVFPSQSITTVEAEEIKTYTEEELAEQVKLGEEKGYEQGFKAATSGIEAKNASLLEEINNRLLMMAAAVKDKENELETESLKLVSTAVRKLLPQLETENSKEIVNAFLTNNFKNFKDEAKLAFYFNPETIGFVQENIARLANIHDFEGKISLHKDANLGVADCRIEWESGGVERRSEKILAKVDNLLEETDHKN